MAHSPHKDRLRARIAYEAARIMHSLGRQDFKTARTKAAQRMDCRDQKRLPSNAEIEQALLEYRQLFHANEQQQTLDGLRRLALEAMEDLNRFSPRLVGPVLSGNADSNSLLLLHLFSESPEQIALFLLDRRIPYQEIEKSVIFSRGHKQRQPAFRFHSGETPVELVWFPPETIGHPPLSPIDQKPEKRATLLQLKNMLNHR